MKFLKVLAISLFFCFIFAFFGGWMIFDFNQHYYITTAVLALIIAIVATIFYTQGERINQLEERIKQLEEKK